MDIAIASDNNYAPHAATLICSICENNKENINVHLIDGGIEEQVYKKIESLKEKYTHLTIKRYIFTETDIRKRIGCDLAHDRSLSAYSRILIPELVDESIDKIVYLDADGIICSSIKELFEIDMKDYAIAGVLDVVNCEKRLNIGLKLDDKYINSGMILWNLRKCREIDIVNKFIEFIKSKNGNVVAMDQGTINGTLKGNILILHPKWNVLTPFYQLSAEQLKRTYNLYEYYSQKQLDEAIKNPIFVHFVPNYTSRPWCKGCRHPLQEEYLKYRNMTEFKVNRLEKDKRRLRIKLIGKAFYLLPYPLFDFIFNKLLYDIYKCYRRCIIDSGITKRD